MNASLSGFVLTVCGCGTELPTVPLPAASRVCVCTYVYTNTHIHYGIYSLTPPGLRGQTPVPRGWLRACGAPRAPAATPKAPGLGGGKQKGSGRVSRPHRWPRRQPLSVRGRRGGGGRAAPARRGQPAGGGAQGERSRLTPGRAAHPPARRPPSRGRGRPLDHGSSPDSTPNPRQPGVSPLRHTPPRHNNHLREA